MIATATAVAAAKPRAYWLVWLIFAVDYLANYSSDQKWKSYVSLRIVSSTHWYIPYAMILDNLYRYHLWTAYT